MVRDSEASLESKAKQEETLSRVRSLSNWLDTSIRIPGTDIRVGADPIIGLIPGIGDIVTLFLSAYIILLAVSIRASPWTVGRMVLNVGIETLIGAIPLFGDIFDVFWKANDRNRRLLEASILNEKQGRRDKWRLLLMALGLVVSLGLLLWGSIYLFMSIVQVILGWFN